MVDQDMARVGISAASMRCVRDVDRNDVRHGRRPWGSEDESNLLA
jgi:hypothetical protein